MLKRRDHILAEDLKHFLNAKHAVEAFDMLDDDKDGKASLKDVRTAVCTIFRCCQLFACQTIIIISVLGQTHSLGLCTSTVPV